MKSLLIVFIILIIIVLCVSCTNEQHYGVYRAIIKIKWYSCGYGNLRATVNGETETVWAGSTTQWDIIWTGENMFPVNVTATADGLEGVYTTSFYVQDGNEKSIFLTCDDLN